MHIRNLLLASIGIAAAGCGIAAASSPALIWELREAKQSLAALVMPAPAIAKGPPLRQRVEQAEGMAFGYRLAPAARPRVGNALPVGKCVNMGGMLERPVEADITGRPIKDTDFALIRRAGFHTVRLPVRFSAHASKKPPYALKPAFMRRVAHVVDTALAADLNVMLDLHHYEEVQKNPMGERDRFVAIWRQISERFAGHSHRLWFELLNEPGYEFWTKLSTWIIFDPAIAEIRKRNPTRPIVVTGGYGSQVPSLANFEIKGSDPNLIPTFHFYDPQEFTHQGAAWTTRRHPVGRRLLEADKPLIDAEVAKVKAYMARTGRVPFIGEYGVIDGAGISQEDRVRYHGLVTAAFASIGVQSCAWSFTNGFSLYKDGRWMPDMLNAIHTTTTLMPR